MMFRQLQMVCVALAAMASYDNGVSAMVGVQLKAVEQAQVPYHIDSLSPDTNLNRIFATHDKYARAFDLKLRGEKDYELPVRAPCGKHGCRKGEKYRCVLHQTIFGLDELEREREERDDRDRRRDRDDVPVAQSEYEAARAFSRLAEAVEESEQDRADRRRPFPGRYIDQYAVGCVSQEQQWASILGHNLDMEVCHTESSRVVGHPMMITASDPRAGHFYYVKPSTKEVCAIRNYAHCKKSGLCEPHVCVKLHSDVSCMGVLPVRRLFRPQADAEAMPFDEMVDPEDDDRQERRRRPVDMTPDLAVGLRNGQTVFLRNMKLVNVYTPDCNCGDCRPVPIAIDYSPVNDLTYILYERCKGRNFLNAITFAIPADIFATTVIPPTTVFSVRAPGVHFIACCSRSSTVFLTVHAGGSKYYLAAYAPNNAFLIARAAGQSTVGLTPFQLLSFAPIPGCPTSLVTDESCAAYVASDKTLSHSGNVIRLVSADFYASFEIECRKFNIGFTTSANLITKYMLAPVVPARGLDQ